MIRQDTTLYQHIDTPYTTYDQHILQVHIAMQYIHTAAAAVAMVTFSTQNTVHTPPVVQEASQISQNIK